MGGVVCGCGGGCELAPIAGGTGNLLPVCEAQEAKDSHANGIIGTPADFLFKYHPAELDIHSSGSPASRSSLLCRRPF